MTLLHSSEATSKCQTHQTKGYSGSCFSRAVTSLRQCALTCSVAVRPSTVRNYGTSTRLSIGQGSQVTTWLANNARLHVGRGCTTIAGSTSIAIIRQHARQTTWLLSVRLLNSWLLATWLLTTRLLTAWLLTIILVLHNNGVNLCASTVIIERWSLAIWIEVIFNNLVTFVS